MDSQPDRARETLALLLEVSQSFHALMGVDALLPLIPEKLGVLLDAEACSIILYDAERHELYFQVSSDDRLESGARLKEIRFPASEGISGWVVREGQSVLVPDVSREPRFYHAVDRELGTQSRSLICAPLRTRSGTLGVTQAINKRSGPFTEDDLGLLDAERGASRSLWRTRSSTRPCDARRKLSIGTTSSCDGRSATTFGESSGRARCSARRSIRRAAPRRPGRR